MSQNTNRHSEKQSAKQQLENLDVLNNFMFNAIATDPDVKEPFFREVLSTLLEKNIGDISVQAQSYFPGTTPGKRGIIMDAEIWEADDSPANCTVYNIEPQRYTETHLQKRVRFYQAKKDSKGLKSGERNWNKLSDLYMIVIANYDPFGEDSMIYTFENTCKEFPNLPYNDGLKIIYFNTTGKKNCKKSIQELLLYLNSSKIEHVTNNSIEKLHNYVTEVKQEAEVINRYMTVGEWLDYEVRDAKILAEAEGRAEGRAEGIRLSLISFLSNLGPIPEALHNMVEKADEEVLKNWILLAARSDTIEDFLEQAN